MEVDWIFAGLYSLAGVHVAVLTSLFGMRKGAEMLWWLAIALVMSANAWWLGISHPFWTILVACAGAGLVAGSLQTLWMQDFRKNNPWYEPAPSRIREAGSLLSFSLASGALLGGVFGTVAWAMQTF